MTGELKATTVYPLIDPNFKKTGKMYAIIIEKIEDKYGLIREGIEIGAYDGEMCVGGIVISEPREEPLLLISWLGEESLNIIGAKEGNEIQFRIDNYRVDAKFEKGGRYGMDLYSVAKITINYN